MPAFDGTGPLGYGPRTGGGFGYCPPAAGPAPFQGYYGFYGVGRGGHPRGGGRGRAWGGGRGGWWRAGSAPYPPAAAAYPAPAAGDELSFLRSQAAGIEEELDSIRRRIAELEKSASAEREKE